MTLWDAPPPPPLRKIKNSPFQFVSYSPKFPRMNRLPSGERKSCIDWCLLFICPLTPASTPNTQRGGGGGPLTRRAALCFRLVARPRLPRHTDNPPNRLDLLTSCRVDECNSGREDFLMCMFQTHILHWLTGRLCVWRGLCTLKSR